MSRNSRPQGAETLVSEGFSLLSSVVVALGNLTKGAESGAIAGTAYGAVFGIIVYLTLVSMKDSIEALLIKELPANSPYTADQLLRIGLLIAPLSAIVSGVAGGFVLGAVFGWLFEKIPGGAAITRGLIFGIIFWSIFSVLGGLSSLQYGEEYYLMETGLGLVTALLFGWLMGYSYGRLTSFERSSNISH